MQYRRRRASTLEPDRDLVCPGNHSQSCSIRQRGNNLELSNESGDHADGQITGKRELTTNWNGTPIAGTVTLNGTRINWDNGTFWTRSRVYSAPSY